MCVCCLFLIWCVICRFTAPAFNSSSQLRNNSSNIRLQNLWGGQMPLFFLPLWWLGVGEGVKAAGCRGGERGFGDWQTLRSHASLVVIKNKHSERGKETHIPPELGQIQGTEEEHELWPFTPSTSTKQHTSKQSAWRLHSKLDKTQQSHRFSRVPSDYKCCSISLVVFLQEADHSQQLLVPRRQTSLYTLCFLLHCWCCAAWP